MGLSSLFGGKTKIYVSSTIYNMAGAYEERKDYLKFLVINGVLLPQGNTLAETITGGTLNGPRLNYRAFFRWANLNYPEGMPLGGIVGKAQITPSLLAPHIPVDPGLTAFVDTAIWDYTDFSQWAAAYVYENHPDLIMTDWSAEIDDNTDEITITFEDESTESFFPNDFVYDNKYIYARYKEGSDPVNPNPVLVIEGEPVGPLDSEDDLPDLSDHYMVDEEDEYGLTQHQYRIWRTVVSYSDGRPDEVSETRISEGTRSYDRLVQTFERFTGLREDDVNPDQSWQDLEHIMVWEEPTKGEDYIDETVDTVEIEPGVFQTTTITESLESFLSGSSWWYSINEYEIDLGILSDMKFFLYREGSGNTDLDALIGSTAPMDGYFPMIPLRTHNKMIDEEPYLSSIYDQANKAWKRASGGKKISHLLDQVKDNENLGDIDHAFVVYGVPLNTITRDGKLYIYEFFKMLMENQQAGAADFLAFIAACEAYQEYLDALDEWKAQGSAVQTEPPPPVPAPPPNREPAATEVRLNGQVPDTSHFDFRIRWNAIRETVHAGKWKPDANLNDTNVVKGANVVVPRGYASGNLASSKRYEENFSTFLIYFQETDNQYRILEVIGAVHENVVYKNKSVVIPADEALDDGDDSGFIIPLHYNTLRQMPITRANQLCLEGAILVFNCYVVKKQKWYETFLGQIFIGLVVMGVGALLTGGASILAGGGILGGNAAIGGMFGLSGVAGAVAGAVVNSIVMTTVMHFVGQAAGKMGALGPIFAAVVGIALGGMSASMMGGQPFSFDIFLRADNLLKLTTATVNAYSIHTQQKTQDIYAQMRDLQETYKKEKRKIDELMYELTGFSSGFDPMALTESSESMFETRGDFTTRTLLTGSDISEMTHALIESFASQTLNLDSLSE